MGQARNKGKIITRRLSEMMEHHKLIGDIRGLGFIQGVELVLDRKTKKPAPDQTAQVMEVAMENGLLLGKGGLFGNVIRIQPPIALTEEQVEKAMDIFSQSLEQVERGL